MCMHNVMSCCGMQAPFYWGIKDVQYNDGSGSRTWKQAMLEKVPVA